MLRNIKRILNFEDTPTEDELNNKRLLEEDIKLGQAIRKFFETPVGKYLKESMEKDKEHAKDALTKVDPSDIEEVRKIQNKYLIARSIERYLAMALIYEDQAVKIQQQINQANSQ